MSLRFSISKPLHHLVDEFEGIFLALLGEMQIDHGGFKLRVAHVSLNDAQIHPGFEQMGGIRMAQGVHRDVLFADARLELGMAKGALNAALGHGGLGILGAFAVSPQCGEEQARIAVCGPMAAEQIQGGVR